MPPPQTIDSPIQSASDDTIKAFLALGDDQKRITLGKLSDPTKQALLAGLKAYKPPASPPYTPAALPGGPRDADVDPAKQPGAYQKTPGGPILNINPKESDSIPPGPAFPSLPTVLPESARKDVTPKNMALAMKGQLPYIAAGLTVGGAPQAGIPLQMLLAALGGAGGRVVEHELGKSVGAEEPWAGVGEAAWDVGTTGAETGVMQGGVGLAGKMLKAALPKLHNAVEGIFRAVPSDNPNYRDNVIASLGDLQKMVKSGTIAPRAKGGLVNPEMYFRQVNTAIDKHLQQMYTGEKLAQAQLVEKTGTKITMTENPLVIRDAMRFLVKNEQLDSPVKATALKLIRNPLQPLSPIEATEMSQAINVHLLKHSAKTGEAAYAEEVVNRRIGALSRIDQDFKKTIDTAFKSVGQPGIAGYERRYAALSAINNKIEAGMNPLERQRLDLKPRAGVSLKGHGWGSLVGNVFKGNAGADLEEALLILKESPDIATAVAGPQPVIYQGQYAGQQATPVKQYAQPSNKKIAPKLPQLPPPSGTPQLGP